jgi:hypothetical protein
LAWYGTFQLWMGNSNAQHASICGRALKLLG